MPQDHLPTIAYQSPAAWQEWLEENHASSDGLWLKIAKKASGIPSITYQEAVDWALSYGWIDGQRQSFDDQWFLQRFTPRRSRSRWSQINRDKVQTLIGRGLMRPAGFQEIERAKADGRWDDAYASPTNMDVPDDLQLALDADPAAAAAFEALNASSRYSILYRVHHTKVPAARALRIEALVAMLNMGDPL
ncbi:MAG TPA: YdeI/OmpD-associated family protein [Acidimicrobiia bacterium]|nr:YdeI/OmpD-associated family protein [Acidimicrobiia bacterium]